MTTNGTRLCFITRHGRQMTYETPAVHDYASSHVTGDRCDSDTSVPGHMKRQPCMMYASMTDAEHVCHLESSSNAGRVRQSRPQSSLIPSVIPHSFGNYSFKYTESICDVCIEIPHEIKEKVGSPAMLFTCPACHEKDERATKSNPMPYFAFKQTVEGTLLPACSKPTFIRGVCERASKSQVCAGPILILHFIYVGMNSRGSLPRVLNTALEEYHTPSTLRYHEVEFDFGTSDKLYHWETRAEALATEMGKYVFEYTVVFVSVHSEITRGDLFAGKDEKGEDVAVEPAEFMEYLFSGGLRSVINKSTVFMLSCGPLVAFHKSICSLKKAIAEQVFHSLLPQRLHLTDVRLKPTYTIAFGADRFISAVLKSFIVAFGVRVLIQGHAFEEVITDLLNVSLELRMHSDTFVFQLKDRTAPCLPHPSPNPSVIGIRYSWYHNHRRPWGTALPMSCPKCSSVRSWSRSKTGVDCSNAQARISTCRSPKCKYEFFTYPPQGPYEIVKDSKSTGWIKQMDI
ncbi:hypothetical protein EDD15DRAFT_2202969 [Pisolithus albus]|nr:hypothetical protein EDD15DRAFT_2202969 [Pisolithus albus]